MTDALKNELNDIVKTIVETGWVTRIILFGSLARGDARPDSDIDLCVLTPITDRRPRDITVDLLMKLWDIQKSPLDLLTYRQESFENKAEKKLTFENTIHNEGVVLYDR
ncbi:MAG: nucleotidyltransferase domain-containing protein [Defluviitaleaceae bacterium]|nr:nucleotidyltransferase domain-containing protein [Defluviitaleaceae bacterium]